MTHPKARHASEKFKHRKRGLHSSGLRLSLSVAVPLVLVMGGTLAWLQTTSPEQTVARQAATLQPVPDVSRSPNASSKGADAKIQLPAPAVDTVAPHEEVTEYSKPASGTADMDFELDAIANALSRLNVDEEGQVKLDQQARDALEAAFLQPDEAMGEARFNNLKILIEGALQGEAGHQAAAVAERFYRYSNAYREVDDTFGYHGKLENLEANFEQISRLRHTYLGDELTDSLYGAEHTLMRYTLQSMRIQADKTLSPGEKQTRQEHLRKQVPTSLIGEAEQASTP